MARYRRRRSAAPGFTYLGVMFIVAVLALTATMASVVWSTEQQRANERELAFVGAQFQRAIERYQQLSANAERRYPPDVESLLRDSRSLRVVHHLRRNYVDPMSGEAQWGWIRLRDGGIVGVHSLSARKPMQGTVLAGQLGFESAASYQEWRFVAPSAAALVDAAGRAAAAASAASGAR